MLIHVLKRNVRCLLLSTTMELFFGNQCQFLSQHVKLTSGRAKRNELFTYFDMCFILFRRFPYDRQNCTMKFGSWTYDSSKVNLQFYRNIHQFDLRSYVLSNEWAITYNNASRNEEKYGMFIY